MVDPTLVAPGARTNETGPQASGEQTPGARIAGFHAAEGETPASAAWSDLWRELGNLPREMLTSVVIQLQLVRARARHAMVGLVLAIAVSLVLISVAVIAGLFLMQGVAGGLDAVFGNPWAGRLIVGAVVLGLLGYATRFAYAKGTGTRVDKKNAGA